MPLQTVLRLNGVKRTDCKIPLPCAVADASMFCLRSSLYNASGPSPSRLYRWNENAQTILKAFFHQTVAWQWNFNQFLQPLLLNQITWLWSSLSVAPPVPLQYPWHWGKRGKYSVYPSRPQQWIKQPFKPFGRVGYFKASSEELGTSVRDGCVCTSHNCKQIVDLEKGGTGGWRKSGHYLVTDAFRRVVGFFHIYVNPSIGLCSL